MQMKKSKAFLAALLAAASVCSVVAPATASAAVTRECSNKVLGDTPDGRTKVEAYGDETYAQRFMSLYDDVITNGVENGYMSDKSTVSGGLGVPYHSAEELCIEAPDYGHETTSEAMSYLVWVAAMRDNIVNAAKNGEVTVKGETKDASTEEIGDTAKAWLTMEATLVPDAQGRFMSMGDQLSATYSDEWQEVSDYPTNMDGGFTAKNPIHSKFCNAYGNDGGLYLMNWLADVDDWYGFGDGVSSQYRQKNVSGNFTLINSFQRGEQESCWETIPHASIEELKFGVPGNGMKAFFNTEDKVAAQFAYTNAPDAEDRAIQAVYAANRWGVGDQKVNSKWGGSQTLSQLAGKMGDECRNNMYDKYYNDLGAQKKNQQWGDQGKHYLMNWYTSWGGALDGGWAWQIGASHCHEFYQNPLAAYALVYDSDLNAGMLAQGATEDYKESLQKQMELYMWLLSKDGPIAGGCTNSWNGRYEQYPSGQSTFNKMAYVEHPVYADPGSNHWIGNQVWAVQRLAELYYVVKSGEGAASDVNIGGKNLEECLEIILDKWVGWFLDNTILGTANATKEFDAYYEPYDSDPNNKNAKGLSHFEVPDLTKGVTDDEKSFSIPASLIWEGQPNDWTGTYTENNNLTCTIVGYGDGDIGCVSSLANTLFYYAKAKGVTGADLEKGTSSYKANQGTKAQTDEYAAQALYLGKELMDRMWDKARDDMGLSIIDHNTNLPRLWNTKLELPNGTVKNGEGNVLSASRYTGSMPNGDTIKDGVAFYDIRTNYKTSKMYQAAKDEYEATGNTDGYYFKLHRFWHEGDALMALGTLFELYPELTPDDSEISEDLKVDKDSITLKVGESDTIKPNKDGCTFESEDPSIATVDPDGKVTGVAEGETTITVTDGDGNKVTVKVTVTDKEIEFNDMIGDCNLDGSVSMIDLVYLNKYLANVISFNAQQMRNAQCFADAAKEINPADANALMLRLAEQIDTLPVNE